LINGEVRNQQLEIMSGWLGAQQGWEVVAKKRWDCVRRVILCAGGVGGPPCRLDSPPTVTVMAI
jgi:hypothetical protein